MSKQCRPEQTSHIGAVRSGSTLFAILAVILDTSKDSQTDDEILCKSWY